MSILELLGITWLVLLAAHFLVGLFRLNAPAQQTAEATATQLPVQKELTRIVNQGINIRIEIINFDDATIYYAYYDSSRKFLTQGKDENEIFENLAKKHGTLVKFNVVSREYVSTYYES